MNDYWEICDSLAGLVTADAPNAILDAFRLAADNCEGWSDSIEYKICMERFYPWHAFNTTTKKR